jgi:hypothetical protein
VEVKQNFARAGRQGLDISNDTITRLLFYMVIFTVFNVVELGAGPTNQRCLQLQAGHLAR